MIAKWLLLPALGLVATIALGETFPSKPVRVIVPWPAGGPADTVARQVGKPLAALLRQPVIVENRPGASGAIGAAVVAKAKPDGYTLLLGSAIDQALAPALQADLPYDPVKDFVPIGQVNQFPLVLVTPVATRLRTVEEIVTLAKAKPGQLSYASSGNNTANHLLFELLKQRADLRIVHVPYKGQADVMLDLLGGRVQATFLSPGMVAPHVSGGKLYALMTTAKRRMQLMPDVPTAAEVGMPELQLSVWAGFLAPAGTPHEVVRTLGQTLVAAAGSREFREAMEHAGNEIVTSTPAEFAAFITAERARWVQLVRTARLATD